MSEPLVLTANERRMVELGRMIKNRYGNRGHGKLVVEYRDGVECLFDPTLREVPMRPR